MGSRLLPWPPLPDLVAKQLEALTAEDEETDDEGEQHPSGADPEIGTVDGRVVPPWDLTALDGELEEAVFSWLDDVAMWHNYAYGWQDDQVIPACWQEHPGLALDLAATAFGRVDAYQTSTAAYVGRWHSDWEDFQRRMAASLGESGRDCRRGAHERPSRYTLDAVREKINHRRSGTHETG